MKKEYKKIYDYLKLNNFKYGYINKIRFSEYLVVYRVEVFYNEFRIVISNNDLNGIITQIDEIIDKNGDV